MKGTGNKWMKEPGPERRPQWPEQSDGGRGVGWGLRGQLRLRGQSTGGFIAGRHPLTSHREGTRWKQKTPLGGSDEGSLEQPHGSSDKERASEEERK